MLIGVLEGIPENGARDRLFGDPVARRGRANELAPQANVLQRREPLPLEAPPSARLSGMKVAHPPSPKRNQPTMAPCPPRGRAGPHPPRWQEVDEHC
jgi:hypothetical protein